MKWWVCDPGTGSDEPYSSVCPECDGLAKDPARREFQRRARCPFVPEDERGDEPPRLSGRGAFIAETLDLCPMFYARSEAAEEAARAWRWWSKCQLSVLYPNGIPACVVEAVDVADETAAEFRAERDRLRQSSTGGVD